MESPSRILIVDDERYNIKVLTEFLREDYKIMAAKNGQQAIQATLGDNPPDLILMDIMMPEMDGYEACKTIKQNGKTSHIPVIFVTAMSEAMDDARSFEVGGVDYITKPFNPVTVRARVNTHITLRKQQLQLEQALAEVKTLSGFLPICSFCKKIRDDEGYWQQLEQYISEHSEALFTHGFCEECAEKHYGELMGELETNKGI